MTIRSIILLCLLSSALSVAGTRYWFPAIETKTVEVTKEVIKTDVQIVTHTITQPNGVVDTTTTTTDHSQRTETSKNQTIVAKRSTINVSALVANDFRNRMLEPVYGVSVSKEVFGPITAGLFILTNNTVGLSVGINF